jgi:hypothetical protein
MTTVAVTDSNNQINDCDDEGVGNWSKINNVGAPEDADDFFYQGINSQASKVGTTEGGLGLLDVTETDMTAPADNTLMGKLIATNPAILTSVPALSYGIGSADSAFYMYYIADDGTQGDIDYPATGSWLLAPINPNIEAWRDAVTGAPALGSVDWYQVTSDFTDTSRVSNVGIDSIDLSPGLYLVNGTSADPAGIWEDFVDDDEGGIRIGHTSTREGIIYCFGTFAIGQTQAAVSTETVFSDENRVLVFPGGRVDDSWNRILVDTATANTDIDFETTIFQGNGRSGLTNFFSSAGDVDDGNEEIDIVAHGFLTGDLVTYSDEGGTEITGLTDATDYFVRAVTDDSIALYAIGATVGRQNAYTDTSRVGLTAAGTGQNHKLTRIPQTVPDLTQTGTSGSAAFDAVSCTFNGFREITLTTRGTLDTCSFLSVGGITLAGGTLTDCTFQDSVLEEGEALITDTTLLNIGGCSFVAEGRGHAVEIDSAGTFAFNNSYSGYGPNRAEFITSAAGVDDTGEVITTDEAHGFSTGDHVYYNKEGGSQAVGLTDGDKYYVNDLTDTTLSLHVSKTDAEGDTARVDLTDSGTETHSLYSGIAVVYNSSGDLVTIDVTTGSAPTVRNSVGSSTQVNASVDIEISGVTEGAQCYMEADGELGPLSAGTEIMNQAADSSGVAASTFSGQTPQGAVIRARSSGTVGGVIIVDAAGGTETNQTAAARDRATTDDIILVADDALVDDYLYIGAIDKFDRVNVDVGVAGTGTYIIGWEYWDGSDWSTPLTGVTDTTSMFKIAGNGRIGFDIPGNWATTSVAFDTPSAGSIDDMYWIRGSVFFNTMTVQPLGNTISVAGGNTVKYLPFESAGDIVAVTGLKVTAVWLPDLIAS